MMIKKHSQTLQLYKEESYAQIQETLANYRQLGIKKYTFIGDGCEICQSLNNQSFDISDAKVGINLPPMHTGCKCTIIAKSNSDLFKDRNGVNPLKDNPRFKAWVEKQQKSI